MAKLASTQIEQLREIGAYLRQVRQQQGRALDDIANQIFIRPALLRSIEEGQDEHLPEPVFVQGFIRRYGEALGLNGHELAQEFTVTAVDVLPAPVPVSAAPPTNGNGHGPVEHELRPAVQFAAEPPVPERPVQRGRSRSEFPIGVAAALLALAVGVGLGVWSLTNRAGQSSLAEAPDSLEQAAETAATAPAPEPVPAPLAEPEVSPEPTLDAPVVADITLSDRAWVSVVADGQKVYEGILESGAQETYQAQNSLRITSGNAGGVDLSFNGSEPVTLGAPGSVRTLTLTPDLDPATLATP